MANLTERQLTLIERSIKQLSEIAKNLAGVPGRIEARIRAGGDKSAIEGAIYSVACDVAREDVSRVVDHLREAFADELEDAP